jgi:hypothetical protein
MMFKLEFKKTFMRTCMISSLAAAVFPATALTYGETRWFDNTFYEDAPSNRFVYSDRQNDEGTRWEWRFHSVYRAPKLSKSCPKTSKADCRVTFSFQPGLLEAPLRIVFNVTPKGANYKIMHRDTHLKGKYLLMNPVFNKSFTLKPGQYAHPTVIHLDKYIPGGNLIDGWEYNGEKRRGFDVLKGYFFEYKKAWSPEIVGFWEGHVFTKTQQMVCITNSEIPPPDNGGVNSTCINKIPEIANGAKP